MARNSEKAMTTLNRWRLYQEELLKGKPKKRPHLASECTNVKVCMKWRREVIGEISKKVAQIQNAGLGEFKLRDLNDEINKLLREKRHWEIQINELGGPNFLRLGPKMLDHEGKEVPGNRGYKYFGAAKDLPGVRELFEQGPPETSRKTRAELMRNVDADYYGYRDEDDGILVPLEAEYEKEAIRNLVQTQKSSQKKPNNYTLIGLKDPNVKDDIKLSEPEEKVVADTSSVMISHVEVPTQKDIEKALILRKKRELLDRYVSDDLKTEGEEIKKMLAL
ncbi:DgyrCDS317 [Dimorphilus gyrociliatus]|uniref:DgyrCDS317 n=1 Tax=Dimorphilus gyrociliatus TaxID=2664684 RepID=A0A7I8V4C4_9ANNE|nr:DgyrCDS317 [Dimorphilus gyrociliatus]